MKIPDETAIMEVRDRLAAGCETMKQLLAGLLDAKGKVAEEVHAIRKLGKSLRGGFSLFRLERSSSMEIQAIGRLLSGPRDAVSRFNTWNKLAWNDDPPVAAAIGLLLEQQTHSAARRPPPETIGWCLVRVDVALGELQTLPVECLAELVAKGFEKLTRRAAKRCRKLDHRSEEDFHEARKAVKALLGAEGFLPEGILEPRAAYDNLADMLGDENDITTLSIWLENHGFTRRFAPDLWKTLKTARGALRQSAIREVLCISSKGQD